MVLLLGFALVGCNSNSESANPESSDLENEVVYETNERATIDEDSMSENTLEGADYVKEKIIWGEDYTKSNAYLADGDSCRLVVPFAYTDESAVVELVSVSGTNTDMADIDLNQDSEWDIIQDVEYKGYKLGICGLMITPTGTETVAVDEMVVSVNGENYTVSFTDPITYIPCEKSEDIFMSTSMMAVQTNDPLTLMVSIGAVNSVTLTGYEIMGEYKEITDPLDPEDGKSCIIIVGNSSYEGDTEVELDEGMEATYKINLAPTSEYSFSYNDFIVYYRDENGDDKKYISCFTNQWIGNEDDVTQMLKLLVDE